MLQFRFTATMEDLLVVTKAGLARMPGDAAVAAVGGPAGSEADAIFRRLGFLLLVVGASALAIWLADLAGVIRLPTIIRVAAAAIGVGALTFGWQLRKFKIDMSQAIGDPSIGGDLANNSNLQKAIADLGELEVTIDSHRVQVSSRQEVVSAKWSDIATVRREGEYIVIAGTGFAGLIVAIPPRALPEGTNLDAMLSMLESLQRGEAVAGID